MTASSDQERSQVVVVTGAASGLGRACALEQARAGFDIVAVDIDADGLSSLVAEVSALGRRGIAVEGSVAEEATIATAADVAGASGQVVGAVTSAAALGPDVFGRDRDVVTMDVDVWDTTMAVNLRGTMLVCKHLVPLMIEGGGGSIVTIASGSAFAGTSARTAYAASKAGVVALTKYVAASYGHRGVRCNCVSPGLVLTPSAQANLTDAQRADYLQHHLVPRLGEPADVASMVSFLLSEASSFITGEVVRVDGGLLSHQPAFRSGPAAQEAG